MYGNASLPLPSVYSVPFPCGQLTAQQTYFTDTARKALPGHYVEFYLSDIQPAAMFWGIMYLQLFNNTPCFFWGIPFVQRSRFMCVKVIHHKENLLGIRVHGVRQIPDFLCLVNGCAVFPHAHMVRTAKRLHKGKYTGRPVADIFAICFPVTSRDHWQRLPDPPPQKLVWLFVHAFDRTFFIIGKFTNVKDILHAGY